jgi:carboxylesterase
MKSRSDMSEESLEFTREQLKSLKAYQGEDHQPFFWKGGDSAVLLIHGFPGSPAEMRPLGKIFHEAGWTVQGILLPGFGTEIGSLHERHYTDWVTRAKEALIELKRDHSVVMIAGFSMGGGLSIHVAAETHPDGVILVSPFWDAASGWKGLLWPLARIGFRRVKPLSILRISDRRIRPLLERVFQEVDLDDPDVQKKLRSLTFPFSVLDELRGLGEEAYRLSTQVDAPTLVIQGVRDDLVPASRTRRLIKRLSRLRGYHEVDNDHEIIAPNHPSWSGIKRTVLNFAGTLRAKPRRLQP